MEVANTSSVRYVADMEANAAHLLVDSIELLPSDRAGLLRVVKDCHRLASWVEAQRLAAVAALAADGTRSPAGDVADAAKTSRFEGDRVVQRKQRV